MWECKSDGNFFWYGTRSKDGDLYTKQNYDRTNIDEMKVLRTYSRKNARIYGEDDYEQFTYLLRNSEQRYDF